MFMRSWAAHSRGASLDEELLFDRSVLTAARFGVHSQDIDKIEERLIMDGHFAMSGTVNLAGRSMPPNCQTAILSLSWRGLQDFKNDTIASLPRGTWVSTGDCVAALLWRSIARAKLAANPECNPSTSTLHYAVGLRGNRDIPHTFFGSAVARSQIGPIDASSSSDTSSQSQAADMIRKSLQRVDQSVVNDLVAWAGTRGRSENRKWAAAALNPLDVGLTSWLNITCYQKWDFAFGGLSAIRQPHIGYDHYCAYPVRKLAGVGKEVLEVYIGADEWVHEFLRKDEGLARFLVRYDIGG